MANKWTSKPPLGTQIIPSWRTDPQYLKLWLLFQEGGGGTAYDLSGNRNHGTLTNMANPPTASSGWATGKLGKGLSFDGVNNYVSITATSLLKPTVQMTIGGWVYAKSAPGLYNKALVFPYATSTWGAPYFSYNFGMHVGKPYVGFAVDSDYTHGGLTSAQSLPLNKWSSISGTFDSGIIKLYVNGVLDSTKDVTAYGTSIIYGGRTKLFIGLDDGDYAVLERWNGLIDDVRIYNRALSAGEVRELFVDPYGDFKSLTDYRYAGSAKSAKKTLLIRSHYGREKPPLGVLPDPQHPLQKGIVGQWLMNEGGGGTAYDLSGNRNHGTLTNMANPPTASSGWATGKLGKGLSFDGVNDCVITSNIIPSAGTISLWFNKSGSGRIITNEVGVGVEDLQIRATETGVSVLVGNAVKSIAVGTLGWHHIAMYYYTDGVVNQYHDTYLDGIYQGRATSNVTNLVSASVLRFGQSLVSAYTPFNGFIDDVRIYNRALTAKEVMELYLQSYCMFPKTKISSQMFNTIPQIPRPLLDYGRQPIY